MSHIEHEYILLLGSDLGDSEMLLGNAVHQIILEVGDVVRQSKMYVSEAWGFRSERMFLNQTIAVRTTLGPKDLLQTLLLIEKGLGRERIGHDGYASRTIDIDILHWTGGAVKEDGLVIPHARMHIRRFALVPICDIAAHWVHQSIGKSYAELLTECTDNSLVAEK
jgi:deoxyguanosine kinase